MTLRYWPSLLCSTLGLLALTSCQSGTPIQTGTTQPNLAPRPDRFPLAVDPAVVGVAAGDLSIDLTAGTAEFNPVRGAEAIGDTFSEIGLAPAFTDLFGKNFEVVGLRQTGPDNIELDFRITHPFTVAKRPDLGIFNTKAWFVTDQPGTTVAGVNSVPGLVTNADGYGVMWSDTSVNTPSFTAAPVQPYVILHEDMSSAPFNWNAPAGFNVLFPGQTSTDTVALDLGGSNTLSVRVYITADYGQSAVRATRQNPAYDLPKFAGNAPWKVAVTEIDNTLTATVPTSTATYQVDVWDWKHGQGLNSDVTAINLNVPDIMASPQPISFSGTGDDPTPLTGTTIVTNALDPGEGDYWGVVTVTDNGSGIGLKDDLATPVALGSYTTYQWFPYHIGAIPNTPPTALIGRCFGGTLNVGSGERFNGTGSTPGTNPIVTYEWDFDYDGSNFTIDGTGSLISHAFPAAGTITVALRVTDGGTGIDIDTLPITIGGTPSWSTATRLTNNSYFEQYGGLYGHNGSSIETTPDGAVHVIWPEVSGSFPAYTYNTWDLEYSGCPPTLQTARLAETHNPSNNFAWNISTAVTDAGVLHACVSGPTGSSAYPEFRDVKYEGGVWSVVGPIESYVSPGQVWMNGQLVANGNKLGWVGMRMIAGTCPSTPAPLFPVYFNENSGSGWGTATQIGTFNMVTSSSGCGGFSHVTPTCSLIGTTGGDWMATWSGLNTRYDGFTAVPANGSMDINWNKSTGGVWGAASILIPGSGSQFDHPIMRRSPNGTTWMVCNSGSGSALSLASYNGTTWTGLTQIQTDSSGSLSDVDYTFDSAGRGMLVSTYDQGASGVRTKTFLQTDTMAAISAAPNVLADTGGTTRLMPMVTAFTDGRFFLAWETDKYGGGPFTAREMDSAIYQ
ncbi:MAG: PKD domain-containing protein [bacterium]